MSDTEMITICDILESLKRIAKGGEGSGNYGHEGRPGEVGGAGDGGSGGLSDRAKRARASYKPANKAAQDIATNNEIRTAKSIGGKQTKDNEAFDVIKGKNAIEVKTIVKGDNPKITMHPESRQRKLDYATKNGATMHTIVYHQPTSGIFYKQGVGSFRLSNMTKIGSERELVAIFK